jgi:iodotyrosine deiodinase
MAEFTPFEHITPSPEEQWARTERFYELCSRRRSIREFSTAPIPQEVLQTIILAAASAPSGANRQPWHFVIVTDPDLKKNIRSAAEKEEKKNYSGRMPQEWRDDLAPLGTGWRKEFLEDAPALVTVFAKSYDVDNGKTHKNYYVKESVGIAVGFLILAIHNAGLVTLTYTPGPMEFLTKLLNRPANERAFLLLPVGYPKEGTVVPVLRRKSLGEMSTWL